MSSALIELQELSKAYLSGSGPTPVLRGISLRIDEGEFVAIVGQSGSGKSTLMNLLGCLDRPTSGRYLLAGRDVAQLDADALAALRRSTFGFIFQRYNLIGNETAAENVEIPAVYAGLARRERSARAHALLGRLGLSERLHYRPTQLSGGQQQRVSIARALMNGGRVILADEPTGALDSQSGGQVMAQLHELHRDGHTVILITHDPALAAEADRTIALRDGVIVGDRRHAHARQPPACGLPRALPAVQTSLLPDILEAVKMAMRALRANFFRTVLTLLGIIIGVGAVVTMLALGDGSKAAVLSRIEAMGTDLLLIRAGARNVRTRDESAALIPEDADALAALPNVREAVAEYGNAVTVRYGDSDYTTTGTGSTANFARARNWTLLQGAFFSEADVKGFAPVAVLGQTVADNLFRDGEEPIGKYILINNIPFQVIGILAPKGANSSGADLDDNILVPLSTARMRLFGRRYIKTITVQIADMAHAEETEAAIAELLAERHRKIDFQIRNMASLLETASQTQNTLTVLLGSIAAISLLVGGIGVMNIMLVSVTERIREIGIRMATGARMLHILLQFMTEALVVCALGGALGVIGGLTAAWIARQLGSPVVFSLAPVLMAFASAFLIGLLFGFLPARRAARLDPVVALAME